MKSKNWKVRCQEFTVFLCHLSIREPSSVASIFGSAYMKTAAGGLGLWNYPGEQGEGDRQ